MKISQIAAKAVVRVFLFMLLLATVPFLQGDNAKLQNFNFIIHQPWKLIFPILLIAGFVTLLITCTLKKYKAIDLNWLLVINTLVLIAYGVAIFIRVYQAVT